MDSLVHAARALTAKMLKMRLLKRIPDRFGLHRKRPTRTHLACYGNVKGTLEFEEGCGCAAQNEDEVEDENEDEVEVEVEVENGGADWILKLQTANCKLKTEN